MMPILYSAVACDNKFAINFASCNGNFTEIAEQVLTKVPSRNHKMTYAHGPYLLHYIVQDKYFYFCITDKTCQRSRAFLFLNEIQRRYDESSKDNFVTVLATEMYRYNEDYSTIIIRKGELDELNTIGVDSSENILGEKILFVNNPDNLSYSTVSYVGKDPERISISVQSPRLHVIFIGIFILVLLERFIFGPASCVLIALVAVFTYVQSMLHAKNKVDKSRPLND
ncbi:LOW QUALITY PROTEIN: vesicle-associated membrane protein 7 [Manduca sexta]|uniref:LOW QUALITY PROTEIN: vesicle-associated membrane protein 7 n=1 Tax=Manduca sexta TaxID=7130 RepID=UPI0018905084|nr:LOW QUALITY PROTEIN: vesicle-associated membrane protein 7 [Manduca sexta]